MTSLFISYSRKNIEVARRLTEVLKGQDLDFWIDWEGIEPTVNWWKEIENGIEQADNFLFLISPDSVNSEVCAKEIAHAVKNGKRLIPIVVQDAKSSEVPAELNFLNWIFFRESDDPQVAIGKLIKAINTDYAWVQYHRQLQVKALEWDRSNHENSLLLRGRELERAEFQLATNSSKRPYPTDLQREYLLKSRQTSDRQRRITMGIAIAAVIALASLAVFGFVQARLATDRARLSQARELAAQSVAIRDTQFDLSLLFAVEAYKTADIPRTRTILLDSTQARPELEQYLHGTAVAASPNEMTIAYAAEDGSISLWDVTTHQNIGQPFKEHTAIVWKILFSQDGNTLVSMDREDKVNIWDVSTRQLISQPPVKDAGDFSSIVLSPDGRILATGTWDDTITLWDVKSGQAIPPVIHTNLEGIPSLAFSPDGKTLAAGGWTDIRLFDLSTRDPIGAPFIGHTEPVNTIIFSPDGKTLASGSDDNKVILWNIESGQPISPPIRAHINVVNEVAFSADGKILASASEDQTIILWDAITGQMMGEPLTASIDPVYSVRFSADGSKLVSQGGDDTILIWNRSPQPPIGHSLKGHVAAVNTVVFSPDGRTLASGSCGLPGQRFRCFKGQIIVWDVATSQPLAQLAAHSNDIFSLAFSPDGTRLASAGCGERAGDILDDYECERGEITLWNVKLTPPAPLWTMELAGQARSVAFSPDGKTVAAAFCAEEKQNVQSDSYRCVQGQILFWDVETGQTIGQPIVEESGDIGNIAFSPDGKTLAAGNWDFNIVLWDVATHDPIGEPFTGHHGSLDRIAFSPDGKLLASTAADGDIIVWDVADHTALGEPFRGYAVGFSANSVTFSPDGKTLATGSWDKTILLWDVETHEPIAQPLKGHSGSVRSVMFSPDGRSLVSGAADGTIILWNMDPEAWLTISCQRAGRNFTRREWTVYFPDASYPEDQAEATCPQWPIEAETATAVAP